MSAEFAGALRERVTIERRLGDRDAIAGASGRHVYDGAAWVAVSPLIPGADAMGDARSALPRWQITMRKREGIGPWTRLVWRGRFLRVTSVLSDPRDPARMVLTCDEVR
ncbi:MAG TPA: head-tail adaptor protein [Chakrabartia sp.]|jgi:head-tail adaptor|nr:head-tail adaptor protein [Chakrabartia sp.]